METYGMLTEKSVVQIYIENFYNKKYIYTIVKENDIKNYLYYFNKEYKSTKKEFELKLQEAKDFINSL
jgi:hypothetical protein